MEVYIIIAVVAVAMTVVGFVLGNRGKGNQQDKTELIDNLHKQLDELNIKIAEREQIISGQNAQLTTLTSERDVQKAQAENYLKQLDTQLADNKASYEKHIAELKASQETQIAELKASHEKHIAELKSSHETQIAELKASHDKQLAQVKDAADKQIEALRQMNREQVDNQLKLIREQMQTTSEEVLKRRQDELGERNREQVSKIIDPLQQSLKNMQEAFDKSKEQQNEALTRLDETIKINMQKSAALGETADRLTRALTGEVKVQGNFGELKLKQLLEDLELKEGEQFDTQETLKDKAGKLAKD